MRHDRWEKMWEGWGGEGTGSDVFARLATRYAEPHRAYHTLNHIAECLGELDKFCRDLSPYQSLALETAIWFHDVVYDPASSQNEAESARLSQEWLPRPDSSVGILILATQHLNAPGGPLEDLMCSIDLAVLGQSPIRYDAYAAAIRWEYASVPDDQYRIGRARILRRFLNAESIYPDIRLREQYEQQARRNLSREIETLGTPL